MDVYRWCLLTFRVVIVLFVSVWVTCICHKLAHDNVKFLQTTAANETEQKYRLLYAKRNGYRVNRRRGRDDRCTKVCLVFAASGYLNVLAKDTLCRFIIKLSLTLVVHNTRVWRAYATRALFIKVRIIIDRYGVCRVYILHDGCSVFRSRVKDEVDAFCDRAVTMTTRKVLLRYARPRRG